MVKRLDLTAIVYVLFLGLCVAGVAAWRRALPAPPPEPRAAAPLPAGEPA